MKLIEADLNLRLKVLSFPDHEENELNDLQSRLMHLGFYNGEIVRVLKRAPYFREPILVEVRGRMVAMSKSEAEAILVEVIS